jgi:hypothetical protein
MVHRAGGVAWLLAGGGWATLHAMGDDEEPRGTLNLRQGLLVLGLFKWMERRQDPDRPGSVPSGPKIEAVLKRAGELTRKNRQDRDAVSEVRASARNSKKTLKQAARASRFGGLHHELEDQNFVFRLIEAARTGNPVTEVSEDERLRIDAVEAMMTLPRAERWALLCEREPALARVEQEVRSGAFGRLKSTTGHAPVETGRTSVGPDGREYRTVRSERGPSTEEWGQELREVGNNWLALRHRVALLLGPERKREGDVLLQTMRAQQAALQYLVNAAEDVGGSG